MSAEAQAPGARLKAERERRGLSLQKAADEMRLDAWVVAALEADEYDRVGPTVYAKGHLKKYASLLTLPWEEILSGYESRRAAPVDAVATTTLRVATPTVAAKMPRGRLAGALLLLLIVAVVLWWKPWQQRSVANARSDPSADVSASLAAAAPGVDAGGRVDASNDVDIGAGAASSAAGDVGGRAESAPAASPAAAAASPAAPPPSTSGGADNKTTTGAGAGAGVVRLRMSFSAESWVEVHDAAGHRVFSGYGQANSVKTLVGEGPLRVYLGFASGVQLEINERAVAIGAPFVHADVARFQAGADGVLRSFANDSRPHG
jgi:cytoskeleton protein RodZ